MTLPFETVTPVEDPRLEVLAALAEKSAFFASLLAQYETRGDLSPKQWACVEREAQQHADPSDTPLKQVLPALAAMQAKFEGAGEHIKKPAIILCDEDGTTETRFQPAPAEGQNAGWIYVKRRGDTPWGWGWAYVAKIHPKTGELYVARGLEDRGALVNGIRSMLSDGLDAAILHFGHKTGACGACGRELTKKESIALGIGPVCAARYGVDLTTLTNVQ